MLLPLVAGVNEEIKTKTNNFFYAYHALINSL